MLHRPVIARLAVGLVTVASLLASAASAGAATANHEGALTAVEPIGLNSLRVTGWARDLDSTTPVRVEILVGSVVRRTVTANLPRKGAPANGFAATIPAPAQPASVCARTAVLGRVTGFVLGCRRLPFAVPIRVVREGGATGPPQFANFYWLDNRGEIAKAIVSAPIVNGVALYNDASLPRGAAWAITVRDATGRPLFRSGPLPELPGPAGGIALTRSISAFRSSTLASFGLESLDGAPQLVTQRLRQLPASLKIDSVRLGADSSGHEVVTVNGRVNGFTGLRAFVYTLALTLRPQSAPGHPADVIVVEPAGVATSSGSSVALYAAALDKAIVEGVDNALETAVKRIATIKLERAGVGFPASLVSVTSLELRALTSGAQLTVGVHAGAIVGQLGPIATG